jgi:hypothetical protein
MILAKAVTESTGQRNSSSDKLMLLGVITAAFTTSEV